MCEKCIHVLRDPKLRANCQTCFKSSKNWTVNRMLEKFLSETFRNQDMHVELLYKDLMFRKENLNQDDILLLSLFADYQRLAPSNKAIYFSKIKKLHEENYGTINSHARITSLYNN
jgi:hypothetical protein